MSTRGLPYWLFISSWRSHGSVNFFSTFTPRTIQQAKSCDYLDLLLTLCYRRLVNWIIFWILKSSL